MRVDATAYRQVMSRLATGVTVLTTNVDGRHDVMTANAVTSVSLDPVLLLASVGRDCRWGKAARAAGTFVVNVLSEQQEDLSRWCASPLRHDDSRPFLQHPTRAASDGSLVFTESLAAFECRLHSDIPVGDHDLLIGEVQDFWVRDAGSPLLFFASDYANLAQRYRAPLSVEPFAACS